jgi:hypothetical protein
MMTTSGKQTSHTTETFRLGGDLEGVLESTGRLKQMQNIVADQLRETVSVRAGTDVGLCDYRLRIPSDLTIKIQESHLALEHIFCLQVEQIYFAH